MTPARTSATDELDSDAPTREQAVVRSDLNGEVRIAFEPTGLVCTVDAPLTSGLIDVDDSLAAVAVRVRLHEERH